MKTVSDLIAELQKNTYKKEFIVAKWSQVSIIFENVGMPLTFNLKGLHYIKDIQVHRLSCFMEEKQIDFINFDE